MLEALFSAAGGGIFGLIGSGFKMFTAYKEKKLQFEHQVNMAKEDRLNMEMEIQVAKIQGSIDLELAESENDAKNLQSAIQAEASIQNASQWVDDLRGSCRPLLTYSLVVIACGMIAWQPENQYNNDLIFLATTAVTFWFGTRPYKSK